MGLLGSGQFGVLAEGIFDLIGPLLIFGIYIIASIAKAAAKKGKTEESEDESQSELQKAVRKRYEQIRQRQLGQQPPQVKRPPRAVPAARPVQQEQNRPRQMSQWEQQQQAIRQRNARLQEQRTAARRQQANVLKQRPQAVSQPKPKQVIRQKPVQPQKRRTQPQLAKAVPQKKQSAANFLAHLTNRPENLRAAIILKEILDKPVALREQF